MEKATTKKNIIAVIVGLAIGLGLVGTWVWYICTLPNLEEQLKYSPFKNAGVWQCEQIDLKIVSVFENSESSEATVIGELASGQETTLVTINFLSTRGFNHKYSFVIKIYSDSSSLSCFAKFDEEKFELLEIGDNDIFAGSFSKLTFNKL